MVCNGKSGTKTNDVRPIYCLRTTDFVHHQQLKVIRNAFTQDHPNALSVTTKLE